MSTISQSTDTALSVREAMMAILRAAPTRSDPIGIEQNGPESNLIAVRFACRDDLDAWFDFFGITAGWERECRYPSGEWQGWHIQLGVHAAARKAVVPTVEEQADQVLAEMDLIPVTVVEIGGR